MVNKLKRKLTSMPVEVRSSMAYVACNIVQRCLSLLTMPLFTRVLTTEQYGQFTVYTSWSSFLMIFLTLNMAYGSLSTAMVRFERDRVGYVSAIQSIAVVLTALFFLIYLPFRDTWNALLELPTALVCLMGIEILCQFALSCWYTLKRFEYQYVGMVAVTLLVAIGSPVLALFLVSHSADKGVARVFGYAAVNIIVGLSFFVLNTARGRKTFDKRYWSYALRFNIPLIPYYLSQVVFTQSDRIMIGQICGNDKAAIYGVAYTLSTVLNFVLSAVNNSYVPWFYGRLKDGKERENRSVANGIALLMAFLLLGIIALAPEIIAVLGGEEYAQAVWVVPPITMCILLLFYAQLFINVEFYYEEKTMLVWGSISSAVLNVALNGLLIPRFGFVAAGYTTLASYIVFVLANYATYKLMLRRNESACDAFDLKYLTVLFCGFAALGFAAMALYELPKVRYAIIATALLAMVVKHKAVIAFIKTVLRR